MKRLFVLLLVVGVVAAGAAAWAQDDPPGEVRTVAASSPEVVGVTPTTQAAETQVSVEVANPQSASEDSSIGEVSENAPAAEEQPIVWPVPEAPPLPAFSSDCEIVHAGARWGVYGVTNLPRGTMFTMTVTDDDETQTVDFAARAGGIVMRGVRYGPVDGYTDDGTTIFGPTSADMIRLETVDGNAQASVTVNGQVVCSA